MSITLTIDLRGGGPYGFRLVGGDNDPLIIAKIRQRSKCAEAGCQEGDAIIGVNGYSTKGLSHGTAMGLVESASGNLTLHVVRGNVNNNAIDAAIQELGSELRSLPSSAQPQQRQAGGSAAFAPAPQAVPAQGAPRPGENATVSWQDGGFKNPGAGRGRAPAPRAWSPPAQESYQAPQSQQPQQPGGFRRQEQTFQEGNSLTRVTTDTSTENVGGNLVTKTRREVTTTIGGGDSPAGRPSMFQVSSNTAGPKPGVWAPGGGGGPAPAGPRPGGMTVQAPRGVNVQQNADRSVTMTLGFGDDAKENVSPFPSPQRAPPAPAQSKPAAPMFSVKKVSTDQAPSGTWNPGGAPPAAKKFAPAPAREPESKPSPAPARNQWKAPNQRAWSPPAQEAYQQPQESYQPPQETYQPPQETYQPPQEPYRLPRENNYQDPQSNGILGAPIWAAKIDVEEDRSIRQHNIPPHLAKIINPPQESGDDSLPSSPGPNFRKIDDSRPSILITKKIYADSSFYSDPEKKYPTIEEQIKMARRVALSLTAPQNKRARGHKMFVKQIEKSERWSTDNPEGVPAFFELDDSDEKYYNPNPWKSGGTWSPPKPFGSVAPPAASFSPVAWDRPARPASPARKPAWDRAPSPVKANPVLAAPRPKPTAPSAAYNPPPDQSINLPTRPLWERLGMDPNPGASPVVPSVPAAAPAAPSPAFQAGVIPAPPPPPPVTNFPPMQITKKKKDDNSMTQEEFERVRLMEPKATHNTVSPQVAFSLADDLRNMKGKGGRLFAKRREKANKGEYDAEVKPNEAVMVKLQLQHGPPPGSVGAIGAPKPQPTKPEDFGLPTGRLNEMVNPPKAAMTPWDACAEYGTTEKAFQHLTTYRPYGKNAPKTEMEKVASKLETVVANKDPLDIGNVLTSAPGPRQPKMPEYSRKIKPWAGASGSDSVSSDLQSLGMSLGLCEQTKTSANFNPKIKPWAGSADNQGSHSISGAASTNNFSTGSFQSSSKIKPVKFMAAQGNFSGNTQYGSRGYGSVNGSVNGESNLGASAAAPMPSPTPSGSSYHSAAANAAAAPREITEGDGFCDL